MDRTLVTYFVFFALSLLTLLAIEKYLKYHKKIREVRYPLTTFERHLYNALLCLTPDDYLVEDCPIIINKTDRVAFFLEKTIKHLDKLGFTQVGNYSDFYGNLVSLFENIKYCKKDMTTIFYEFLDFEESYDGWLSVKYRLKLPTGFLREVRRREAIYRSK